jgi:hypothetical protein
MRVYYTGDIANQPGWFKAKGDINNPNATLKLNEELDPTDQDEPRTFQLYRREIGDQYFGHCNPRFVTADAFDAYKTSRCQPC